MFGKENITTLNMPQSKAALICIFHSLMQSSGRSSHSLIFSKKLFYFIYICISRLLQCRNTLLQEEVLGVKTLLKEKYKSISIKVPKVKVVIMQNGPFHTNIMLLDYNYWCMCSSCIMLQLVEVELIWTTLYTAG